MVVIDPVGGSAPQRRIRISQLPKFGGGSYLVKGLGKSVTLLPNGGEMREGTEGNPFQSPNPYRIPNNPLTPNPFSVAVHVLPSD